MPYAHRPRPQAGRGHEADRVLLQHAAQDDAGAGDAGSPQQRAGETVGILLPNLAATLCMVIGMTAFRRIPAMLNYTAGTDGMQARAWRTHLHHRHFGKFLETPGCKVRWTRCEGIKVIYLEDLQPTVTTGVAVGPAAPSVPKLLEGASVDSPAVVLFTSARRTAEGVVLSHRAILSNIGRSGPSPISRRGPHLQCAAHLSQFGLTGGGLLPILTASSCSFTLRPCTTASSPRSSTTAAAASCSASTFLGHSGKFAHPSDFLSAALRGRRRSCPAGARAVVRESSAPASTRVGGVTGWRRWWRSIPRWRPASAASGSCCPA